MAKNIKPSNNSRNPINFVKAVANSPKDFMLALVEAGQFIKVMVIDTASERRLERKIRDWPMEDQEAAREAAYDKAFKRMHGSNRSDMLKGR
jgi:hypothetical protein